MSGVILPWRNWYHCMGNTYGTWLPGDPKGFRTRHHRSHVEGDYKFPPPPGYYDDLFDRSRRLMPRDLRPLVCRIFADALRFHQVEIVELSVGGVHWHLLARFVPVGVDPYEHLARIGVNLTHARKTTKSPSAPAGGPMRAYDHDPAPRRLLGLARTFVTHELKKRGHFTDAQGGLWALRPKCEPIADRPHQVAATRYIRRLSEQDAAVLSMLREM
jgi:hypothetical protein